MTGRHSPQKKATGAGGQEQRWREAVLCLVLAVITFVVFGQTLTHEFVNLDDSLYVYENPGVARGLTFKGIVWAFTSIYASNWHPLTWISHMLDCQLYGLHPGGHHLTSVLLHAATVIALFLVLRQMTGALWRSAFVAAVFAIHPLRVESVAWVSERKDVLSGLFFILTIGAYVRYARRPWSRVRHGLVVLLFALSLMCKPMLVTLPVVLLLLDYWPLRRAEAAEKLVLEKVPLLALSAASCVVTLLAQTKAIHSTGSYSLPSRLGNALVSCMIYLGQMVWPAGLAVFYPYSHKGLPPWEVVLSATLLAGVSVFAWVRRRQQPWLLVGWVWYLVMLLPVIGVIQAGSQAHADRYTHLPQIGIYVAVTWLMAEWGARWLHHGPLREVLGGVMAGVVVVLMVCAWKQTTYWKNSETLYTHTLDCTKDNDLAHNNLGMALFRAGRVDEAITQYNEALQINPGFAEAHNDLGNALLQKGSVDDAVTQYQQALQFTPGYADPHYNLGNILLQQGKVDEAIAQFQKALRSKPDYVEAHVNLGNALLQKGGAGEAAKHFLQALQIRPDLAEARNNLGNIFLTTGKVDEAIAQYQQALHSKPDYVEAHFNLGCVLLQQGKVDEAITHFQQALQINPGYERARSKLEQAILQKKAPENATAH